MTKHFTLAALAAVFAITFSSLGQAEPFTFTASGEPPAVTAIQGNGGPIGVSVLSSEGKSTFADGRVEEWTSTCHAMMSPQQAYDSVGFCITSIKGSEDTLHNAMVCNNTEGAENANDCWGYFSGGTGRYANASGTLTWHAAEGQSGGGGNLNE